MGLGHSPSIVTNGLVGCWDVASPRSSPGEGTTWTDLSKNGNNGTLTNNPTTAEGINQGIVSFDGTDDYVDCGSTFNGVLTGINSFTISCWVYVESGQVSHANILGNHSSSYTGITLQQDALNDGNFYFSFGTGSSWVNGGTFVVGTENWANVTIVKNSTSLLSYVNGQLVQSAANSESVTEGDYNLRLASGFTSGRFLKGKISNTYIYNRDLTAAEIKQNYNATKGRFSVTPSIVTENLVLHLDAGDSDSYPGTGTTWTDLSGNGNDATLTNGPVYSGSVGGGSFLFDGSDDYAVDTNPTGFTVNHTVSMWIYFSVLDIYRYLLDMGSSHVNWIEITPGGKARSGTNGSGTYCDTSSTMSTGTWYNITRLYNGTSNKVYINSVEECSNTTSNTATPSQIVIGNHGGLGSTNCFSGYVACVYVYSRALTSGEILQNYEAQKGRFV